MTDFIPMKIPDFLYYEWDEKPPSTFYRAIYFALEALRVSLNTLFHRGFDQEEEREEENGEPMEL